MARPAPTDNYIITRDANEAERLELQHRCMISCQGYHLHPTISFPSPSPKIAELCTGTAIWLRELATAHPSAECHGFDISDKMYPEPSTLPSNIKLHIADIKQPFEEKWLGYFDIVHIRLIQAAMRVEEWGPTLRNVTTLLKPGGYLQWYEDDRPIAVRHCFRAVAPLNAASSALSGQPTWHPPPRLETLGSFNRKIIDDSRAEAMNYGYMNLDTLMSSAEFGNLEDVFVDAFVVDRENDGGELRRAWAVMGISAVFNMIKAWEAAGTSIPISPDEYSEKAMEDIDAGAHFVSRATVFVGRKRL